MYKLILNMRVDYTHNIKDNYTLARVPFIPIKSNSSMHFFTC